ncbi:MAG: class I SAM-dependent methyltransferase [Pseudorhodoplanes sp.]
MTGTAPLENELRRLIAVAGPMPVAKYISLCLTHPEHGYYVTRDPFGATGDFTTAPEVSQMFGELVGLWAAAVWQMMGAPRPVRLVELGPGRGTMMRDALRATQVVPGFRDAVLVELVEVSPVLRDLQRHMISDMGVEPTWYDALSDVPPGPCLILANEFVDALPVHQAVRQKDGWHERVIGLNASGRFVFGVAPEPVPHFTPMLPKRLRDAPEGSIFEWRPDNLAFEVGRRVRDNGAALIIDYGHAESATGDTLQAVGVHAFADPLESPGQVDLTAHVDFQAFGLAADSMGAAVHGPVAQSDFLFRLGIAERAETLKANATPEQVAQIDAALSRLTHGSRTGMGQLFKMMALADPRLGMLPGFEI